MPRGYDRPLYILPFDHRGSFQTKMSGWKSALSDEQTAEMVSASLRRDAPVGAITSAASFSDAAGMIGRSVSGSASQQLCLGSLDLQSVARFFWDPLASWRSRRVTRDQTVAEIDRRRREFVGLFNRKDGSLSSVASSSVRPIYRSPMEG